MTTALQWLGTYLRNLFVFRLIAMAVAGVLSVGIMLTAALLSSLGVFEQEGLHALLVRRHKADPVEFEKRIAASAERTARKNPAAAGYRFGPRAEVDDLGTALRIATFVDGSVTGDDGTVSTMQSETRIYVYDEGMTRLSVTCAAAPGNCTDRADLVQQTERALLDRRAHVSVVGILPDGGDCESPPARPGTTRDTALTCGYPSAVVLSVERKGKWETRRLMDALLAPS